MEKHRDEDQKRGQTWKNDEGRSTHDRRSEEKQDKCNRKVFEDVIEEKVP